jgi:hypothetical protein
VTPPAPKNANARQSPAGDARHEHRRRTPVAPPASADRMLVTLSVAELADLLDARLAEREPPAPQRDLMTSAETCEELSISPATLHRLVKQGLPRLMVLDSPRYSRAATRAWLERRSAAAEAAE